MFCDLVKAVVITWYLFLEHIRVSRVGAGEGCEKRGGRLEDEG